MLLSTYALEVYMTAGGAGAPVMSPVTPPGLVMSWMLDRRLSFLFREFRRMKYFCAWLATCAGHARLQRLSMVETPCRFPMRST